MTEESEEELLKLAGIDKRSLLNKKLKKIKKMKNFCGFKMKEYTVYMQWDSYEGSPYVETHTAWYNAYDKNDAGNRAHTQYGHHKGFKIISIDE